MAEAIFNQKAPNGFFSTSVGTKVFDKEGNSCEGEMLENRVGAEHVVTTLQEVGVDARKATRNQITKEVFDEADVVVVMAEKETLQDYVLDNEKVRYWDIEDPKNKSLEETRNTRVIINNLVENLIKDIS
jgi:protein-tyrosine-phosphatase